MSTEAIVALTFLIGIAALLYSSVGHAGASGYLAVMALFGLAPGVMKPTALTLNIVVAVIATVKFYQAGCFSWRLFWPFAITSVPFAYLGGSIMLPGEYYKPLVGLVLLFSAWRLAIPQTLHPEGTRNLPVWTAIFLGMGIGILSGLTGLGGGIFLSPLLLLTRWAEARKTAGVCAAFVLVTSMAGLLGHISNVAEVPSAIPIWAAAAAVGGLIGSGYGSRRLSNLASKRLLSIVLVIAGVKMLIL
jgi:uncharacterized protein